MTTILIALIVNTIIVFFATYIVPGVKIYSFIYAVIVAVVLGFVNAFVHNMLVSMGLPPNYFTYGLLTLLLAGLAILAISYLLPGVEVENFGWAVIFALVVAVLNGVVHSFLHY